MLSKTDIAELLEIAEWLETQPCKSAFSGQFPARLRRWVDSSAQKKRTLAKVFYYQIGYGWRLNRQWKHNLKKQILIVNRENAIAY